MNSDLELPADLKARLLRHAAAEGVEPAELIAQLLNDECPESTKNRTSKSEDFEPPTTYHRTEYGQMMLGDSRGLLHRILEPGSVDLLVTSPPFGLVRQKAYGNKSAGEYCDWFRPFAEGFHRVLKDTGSLVIDIGGAYQKGLPVRSLYQYRLLQMLVDEYGFHLAMEHFWLNPSKMPTPAEWVTIRRIRPKDSVNMVFWLSKTPWPKADNRRVLSPYTHAMRKLLKVGYWSQHREHTRPSEHKISAVWDKDRGGSIPSNLLALPNTSSNTVYQRYCKEKGISAHPARFPNKLPEYFIRMLTDRGDLVVDPFGGSCVSGEVAETLQRRWVCCEMKEEYLMGAKGRFQLDGDKVEETHLDEKQIEWVSGPSKRILRLDKKKMKIEDQLKQDLCEDCEKPFGALRRSALKVALREVTADLTTPDFNWRKDSIKIAPPCSLPVRDEVPLSTHGGSRKGENAVCSGDIESTKQNNRPDSAEEPGL